MERIRQSLAAIAEKAIKPGERAETACLNAIFALANKIVRICWKVLYSGETYRPFPAVSRDNRSGTNTHLALRKLNKLMAQSSTRRIATPAGKSAFVVERFMRTDARGFHQGQEPANSIHRPDTLMQTL